MNKNRFIIHGECPNIYVGVLTAYKQQRYCKDGEPSNVAENAIGWYTFNRDVPECIFDPETILWILTSNKFLYDKRTKRPNFKQKFGPQFNDSCAEFLRVQFVLENRKFTIMSNPLVGDGEYIKYQDDFDWIEAETKDSKWFEAK